MRLNWNAAGKFAPLEIDKHRVDVEDVLSRLSVEVDSFSVGGPCSVPALCRAAADRVTVLYVIKGEGTLQWSGGELALREGMIALVPSKLPTVLRDQCIDGC